MIEGQVAIVTGASRGLGRALALRLAAEGVRVVVSARTAHELETLCAEITSAGGASIAVAGDISRWNDVQRVVSVAKDVFGRVDIAVNNAGIGWYKPFDEWTVEEIDRTIDVNLKGPIYLTRAVLPLMVAAGSGQIVNIASDLGRRMIPNMAPYVASKFGLVGFAGSILREVKGKGVKVMTLTPGIIDTWFGGGTAGSREETWSMSPDFVAGIVIDLLKLPRNWVIDELSVHAMGQDF